MKDKIYTLFFAAFLGTLCALTLTFAVRYAAPLQAANIKAEETRIVLEVMGIPFSPSATAQELVNIFEQNISQDTAHGQQVYLYQPGKSGTIQAAAYFFSGQGLWGPVKGFLGVNPDYKTIRSIRFSHQEETPGLGADIVDLPFTSQFVGKQMVNEQGKPGIIIAKGKGNGGPSEVDGISGATLTCNRVQAIVNECIEKIIKEHKPNG